MGLEEAAVGIYRVAVARIADLIRKVTVERGLDPREFALQSFGGSGGLFAASYARDLAIRRVIVPQTAAVLCAFGMVASDVLHDYAVVRAMPMTTDPEPVNAILAPMAQHAMRQLGEEGFAPDKVDLEWIVEMRYGRQVHQVSHAAAERIPGNAANVGGASDRIRAALRTAIRPRFFLSRRRCRARHLPPQGPRHDEPASHGARRTRRDRMPLTPSAANARS